MSIVKPSIEINQISKRYKRGLGFRYLSLRDEWTKSIQSLWKKNTTKSDPYFWALKELSLSIQPGERIGIIGNNGAGKSTLLKIMGRITPPTTGEMVVRGRVGSLLEIGTGFHTELTGLENIYVYGSILGLKRNEINRQLDQIIDFSGVGDFIHTPLKQYSSGMHMRLGFSVAAHLQSEILLVDEVLAVGDYEFQQRCIGKMNDISHQDGRTIIFVSHDLSAIGTLTDKCLLLDQGKLIGYDKTGEILSQYTRRLNQSRTYQSEPHPTLPSVTRVEVKCSEGELHGFGKPFQTSIRVNMPERNVKNMTLSVQVINAVTQKAVLHYHLFDLEQPAFRKMGDNRITLTASPFQLYKGSYFLRVYLAESKTKIEFERIDCCYFRLEMLGIPEIEWGWDDEMCQWLQEGNWEIE